MYPTCVAGALLVHTCAGLRLEAGISSIGLGPLDDVIGNPWYCRVGSCVFLRVLGLVMDHWGTKIR